jgi:hypothetical protein
MENSRARILFVSSPTAHSDNNLQKNKATKPAKIANGAVIGMSDFLKI